jgi:cation:H+ antiporter
MSHIALLLEFVAAAIVIWVAGVWLTRTTDALDAKYSLGSAFGGLLILGITTSLPEMAVVVTAALQHHYDIIIGTLIGGIAIQTVVLCLLDAGMKSKTALTYSAASLSLVLEAAVVILVTVAAIIAIRTPAVLPHTSISFASLLILGLWLVGLWLVYQARKGLPWKGEAVDASPGRAHHERQKTINHPSLRGATMTKVFGILFLASIVTLLAGYEIETIGSKLAVIFGIGSGLFAATFIALSGALPNISTGLSSIKLGDYKLAMSDIFGGNAIMPAFFILCDIISGHAVLAHATPSDIWFAALGVLLTGIYIIGLIVRPKRLFLRMGIDSLAVLTLYIIGIIVLTVTGG